MAKATVKDKLNPKQELFCNLYVSKEYFGNGVQAYAKAYSLDLEDPKAYRVAKTNAARLLTNADISARIKLNFDEIGLTNDTVDRELATVVFQNNNLHAKVSAIDLFNKVRGRYKNKPETKGSFSLLELLQEADKYKKDKAQKNGIA